MLVWPAHGPDADESDDDVVWCSWGWFTVLFDVRDSAWAGLPEAHSLSLLQMTLIVVALSIVLHGISVTPLMSRYVQPSAERWQN